MHASPIATPKRTGRIHRWIRAGFLTWALVSTAWMANSVRTQGVDDSLLRDAPGLRVVDAADVLEFQPTGRRSRSALIFVCGSGIHAHAYAPLLRPLAEAGHPVFVLPLPYRFAPLDAHRVHTIERISALMAAHPEVHGWVLAGHSLGAAIVARAAASVPAPDAAFVLLGTTHPRDHDLSGLDRPVTKVLATLDGVAPLDRALANRTLLPPDTRWIEIAGGNHSQFGHYGHQLFDGTARISREAQQGIARQAMRDALEQRQAAASGSRPRPGAIAQRRDIDHPRRRAT